MLRMVRTWVVVGVLVSLTITACGRQAPQTATGKTYVPSTPEAGTAIPNASVTFGMRPYADNTFYVVGMQQGWFKDVGININPAPYGLKTTEDQWLSILLNRQADVTTATCSLLLPSYRTTDQPKCLGLAVTFYGQAMLANPDLHLKTVAQYIQSGSSFTQALKQALTPLEGKTIYVPSGVASKEFEEAPFKLAGLQLPHYVTMDDSQMLLLAKSGRADIVFPNGAPIAETLLQSGFTPVYDTGQLLKNGPGGLDSPIEPLVSNNGFAATADYVSKHQTTVLRFASVMFRIFDALQKDPSLYGVYAPYLNSVAGTSLDAAGVERTVNDLDPFVPYDQQKKYFEDPKSSEYYKNSMGALINSLAKSGSIRQGITPDQVMWAAPIYEELRGYQRKTDTILRSAQGKQLSGHQEEMVQKAKQYYGWYDFLDAYRFAKAASL